MTNLEVWLENFYKVHLASVYLEHYVEPQASVVTTYEPYTDLSGLPDHYSSFLSHSRASYRNRLLTFLSKTNWRTRGYSSPCL